MSKALLALSFGKSRKETNWKQINISWEELVEKLSTTHRTAETYSEYVNASTERQAEIKDVGGFVGGNIIGGRRKKGSVEFRQLLTLDVDKAKKEFWEDFKLLFPCAALVYSTHKHSSTAPRLRLLIPVSRKLNCDEYEAVSRMVAGMIDIDQFDPTTFEPERLMYWPSTSKDGDYIFSVQEDDWLNPDEILKKYNDWKDTSQWPYATGLHNDIKRRMVKAGDPLLKDGLVGAFCRTYENIEEVIEEFLPDVYEKSDEGRYTYKEGSTANGLVIYENKFAYSHHGTDPAGGKLCNAWDLVRIHKFISKDDKALLDTPIAKLPSQIAMQEFVSGIKAVRRTLGIERAKSLEDEFGLTINPVIAPAVKGVDPNKWFEKLNVDRKGNAYPTIENIVLILNNDPLFKNCFAFDEFRNRLVITRNLPWRNISDQYDALWKNSDDSFIRHHFEKAYNIVHKANLVDALEIVFKQNSFHPVKSYIEKIKWDGKKRAEEILIKYLGAEDSEYVRTVTIKTLLAAISRIYEPGIKFDNVLMLIGKQGTGKSTLIKKLGIHWYSDTFGSIQNNKAYEQIQGVWLMEIGELAGLKRAEVEEVKHFISKQEDSFRPAYARSVEAFPRQNIFIASTNEETPLIDKTGNRRFWPVRLGFQKCVRDIFIDFSSAVVDQIWAEVLVLYRTGAEDLFLDSSMVIEAKKIQSKHTEEYVHAGLILSALEKLLPLTWGNMNQYERRAYFDDQADRTLMPAGEVERVEVCSSELWCEVIGLTRGSLTPYAARELTAFLRSLEDWEEAPTKKNFNLYGRQRYFRKFLI